MILIPRWIDVERVTFKYGLGDDFINVLKTLQKLELVSTEPVEVRGVKVSPRDVVAAALPDPAELGDRMHGRTCAGTWVKGLGPDGEPREVYVYHVVDNAWSMKRVRPPGRRVADGGDAGRGDRADGDGRVVGQAAWSGRRRCPPSRSSSCSTSTAWSGSGPSTAIAPRSTSSAPAAAG